MAAIRQIWDLIYQCKIVPVRVMWKLHGFKLRGIRYLRRGIVGGSLNWAMVTIVAIWKSACCSKLVFILFNP